jgi:hypothetical protein
MNFIIIALIIYLDPFYYYQNKNYMSFNGNFLF